MENGILKIVKGAARSLPLFVGITLLLIINVVQAADLYKYKDENGKWVFTDKKPKNKNVEPQRLLVTEAKAKASMVNQGTRERPKLVGLNPLAGPVQMWVDFSNTSNMKLTAKPPHEWVLEANTEKFLTALEKIHFNRSWSYQWQAQVVLGKPMSRSAVDATPMGLPFKGGPFVISQGFKGDASHNSGPQVYYSIDITMPKGTPIVAARDGVVMDAESDFSRSGWSEAYADEANFVRVVHSDGSMAVYAHLDADGIVVGVGQAVQQGDLLGYSGTTGYSTGPHLHFALQINEGKKLVSLPFEFERFGVPELGKLLLAKEKKKRASRGAKD